jgi:hypothetical protein
MPTPVLVAVEAVTPDRVLTPPDTVCLPVKVLAPSAAKVPVALGSVIVAVTASTGVSVVDPLVAPARTKGISIS